MLALRDERRSRDFDLPGAWWPDAPGLIGGRDRQAGGTWCASDVARGVTAVVLNRPERRTGAAGAPSRGVLPILAATAGAAWPDRVTVEGMASFNLVLAGADRLRWWSFDGDRLEHFELEPGCHVFKPRGRVADGADGVDARLTDGPARLDDLDASTAAAWGPWFTALQEATPTADGSGLLAHRDLEDGDTYETVFGQFIAARPGTLRLDTQTHPAAGGAWATQVLRG